MSKETKKQIVAQAINKVSAQYNAKLKTFQKQNEELKSKCSTLYNENKSLKENLAEANEKIRQYEDWIQRLQEFMDMPESMRQEYVEKHKKDKAELNFMSEFLSSSPLSKIFDFYSF